MDTLVYRIAVLRERAERVAWELTRAQTHLGELSNELVKLAREIYPTPLEVAATIRQAGGNPDAHEDTPAVASAVDQAQG